MIYNEWDIKVESKEEEIKVDSNEEELNVDSDEVVNKVDTFEEEFKMDNNEWDNKVETEKEEIKGDNNDEDLNVDSDGEEIKDSSDEEGYDNHKGIIKSHCDEELTKDETNLNNPDEYTNQSMWLLCNIKCENMDSTKEHLKSIHGEIYDFENIDVINMTADEY